MASVRWRVISTYEGGEAHGQYGGGCAVPACHTISTDVSHLQYGGGCVVRACHIISSVEGVQYESITTSVRTGERSTGLLRLLRG